MIHPWIFDIELGRSFNPGRFDLGSYPLGIYGLLAVGLLLIVLLIRTRIAHVRLVQKSVELSAANKSLEQLSLHDGLTNLANRRHFDGYLATQVAVANRHKRTLALVLCDIDAFKAYNDHCGHLGGDECLKQVSAALLSCCRRPADMVARYGGEEFAIILPDTELMAASQIAEAARDAVAQLRISHEHSPAGPYVSISAGVAVPLPRIDISGQQLMMAADQALYKAKNLGRNQIVCVHAKAAYEYV